MSYTMIKNNPDKKLIKKMMNCLDKQYYTCYQYLKYPNNAIIRPDYNKFQQKEFERMQKKSFENFIAFLDMATDMDPVWCFITGDYIPPRFRGTIAVRPLPKSPWCYKRAYDNYINSQNISDKLEPDSNLIFIGFSSDEVVPNMERPLVQNNENAIMAFFTKLKDDVDFQGYHLFDWKYLRQNFFLKPNGKPFTR